MKEPREIVERFNRTLEELQKIEAPKIEQKSALQYADESAGFEPSFDWQEHYLKCQIRRLNGVDFSGLLPSCAWDVSYEA